MLAEKQAAIEKLEWQTKVANEKVEELQVDVASMDAEVSALMKLFRKITENDRAPSPRDTTDDLSLECEPIQLDVSNLFLADVLFLSLASYQFVLAHPRLVKNFVFSF